MTAIHSIADLKRNKRKSKDPKRADTTINLSIRILIVLLSALKSQWGNVP